jgi:hypothetical protein
MRLPTGSFTLDREGRVIISTVTQSFPDTLLKEIGDQVLATFRSAQEAQLPLSELIVHFSSLTLTARELRGGAIIFLSPQMLATLQQ